MFEDQQNSQKLQKQFQTQKFSQNREDFSQSQHPDKSLYQSQGSNENQLSCSVQQNKSSDFQFIQSSVDLKNNQKFKQRCLSPTNKVEFKSKINDYQNQTETDHFKIVTEHNSDVNSSPKNLQTSYSDKNMLRQQKSKSNFFENENNLKKKIFASSKKSEKKKTLMQNLAQRIVGILFCIIEYFQKFNHQENQKTSSPTSSQFSQKINDSDIDLREKEIKKNRLNITNSEDRNSDSQSQIFQLKEESYSRDADDKQEFSCLKLVALPVLIPFRVIKYFLNIPHDFAVALINAAKSKMSPKKDKKNQAKINPWLKFLLYVVIFCVIYISAFFFSSALYTLVYMVMIPTQSQEVQLFFDFSLVEDEQKEQLLNEAYLGQGIANYMQQVPNLKLVANSLIQNSDYQNTQTLQNSNFNKFQESKNIPQKIKKINFKNEMQQLQQRQNLNDQKNFLYKQYLYALSLLGIKQKNPYQIEMNKESYNIELILQVKENALTQDEIENFQSLFSSSNEQENLYYSQDSKYSDFSTASEETKNILKQQLYFKFYMESFNKMQEKLIVNRVGSFSETKFIDKFLNNKIVDIVHQLIPLSNYILKNKKYQEIRIKLNENFDNRLFELSSMKIEVFSVMLQNLEIRKAFLKVRTVFSGIRYLMHEWQITSASVFILTLSAIFSICSMSSLLFLKTILNINY